MFVFQGNYYPQLQFLIFGLMSFTAGVISWKLPETANKPLPEDLSDLEEKVKDKVVMVTPLSEDKVKLLEADISEKYQQMMEDGVEV